MAYIKKTANGQYYLHKRLKKHGKYKTSKNTFIIKQKYQNGYLTITKEIIFPPELIGKKIQIQINIIEDLEK